MLPTDWSSPGTGVLERLPDRRVTQNWDKNHLFSKELRRKIQEDSGHPRPSCCDDHGDFWDMVALYSPEARWEGLLPRAVLLDGPVWRVTGLSKALDDLLIAPGGSHPSTDSR